MGLFDFISNAGEKIFGSSKEKAKAEGVNVEDKAALDVYELKRHVEVQNLGITNLVISRTGDVVTIKGNVTSQENAEKAILTLGNVQGIAKVNSELVVEVPAPEAKYHTVKSGEFLSKIAKAYYGDANKYNLIFEANKPMLKHPDKIYPGQVLRIPEL